MCVANYKVFTNIRIHTFCIFFYCIKLLYKIWVCITSNTHGVKYIYIRKVQFPFYSHNLSMTQLQHENTTSWFLRQPYFQAKGNGISNVFFFDGSSGVPVMPETVLVSVPCYVLIFLTFFKIRWYPFIPVTLYITCLGKNKKHILEQESENWKRYSVHTHKTDTKWWL